MHKDISGQKFGKLTALYPVKTREPSNGVCRWFCSCDCGNFHIVNGNHLRTGRTKSCGCLRRKTVKNEFI